MDEEFKERFEGIINRIEQLDKFYCARMEHLKKVIADYLEAGSNIALASVKANLKSV